MDPTAGGSASSGEWGEHGVCEYCGCKGVPSIAELMDEHAALLHEAAGVRAALGAGDRALAADRLGVLVAHLGTHVSREETGVFTALRRAGDFVEEVEALEEEHVGLDRAVADLDQAAPDFGDRVTRALDDLAEHIEREDLGIFPVSVVSLGASGWETVGLAHARYPTFLPDRVAVAT